jgi:hypothetical protein
MESGLQLSVRDMQMLKNVPGLNKVVLPVVGEHIVWAPFIANIGTHLKNIYSSQKFDEKSAWANVPYVMDKKHGKDTAAAKQDGKRTGTVDKNGKPKDEAKRTWWFNKISSKCQWDPPPHIAKRIKEAEKQTEAEARALEDEISAGRTSPKLALRASGK